MTPLALSPTDAPALQAATGESLTYRELLEGAARVARALGPERSLLFLACRNDAFTVTTYLAALTAGHPVALMDGARPAESDADLMQHYRPAWVAGAPGIGEALAGAGIPVDGTLAIEGGELVRTGYTAGSPLHPQLAVLLLTSGTTGSRRLVRLSPANIEANATSIATYLGLSSDERPITSLPLHYSFGLSVLNSHLLAGATLVLTTESVLRRPFWETVERFDCTSLAGVPYTYKLLERIGYRDMDLPSIRTMQQAGGALDVQLTEHYARHMAARDGRFFVMYGQTEATARMAYVPPNMLLAKLGSAGLPIPGGRFRIERQEAFEQGGGRIGEVVYEGPNVMLGYASESGDLALGDELHGELRTGDLGYLDEDGYLFLVGRSKRIAKVFGLRINLDEVERELAAHGPVAVVGGEDALWAFCAFGSAAELEAMGRALAKRLRLHPQAVRIRHVDEIPTSGSGKVDYRAVERWTLT